jgi:Fic family protein
MLETYNKLYSSCLENLAETKAKLQDWTNQKNNQNSNKATVAISEFTNLNLDCSNHIKEVSDQLQNEYLQISEERDTINSSINSIQQKISDLKSIKSNFKKETIKKQEDLVSEIENFCQEKNKEIQLLKKDIEYQEDITEFFKKVSSAEVLDISNSVKIRVKILKDEHVFTVCDQGETVLYAPVSYTQPQECVPPYLKEEISFNKEQYPMLFFNILQYLLNNN